MIYRWCNEQDEDQLLDFIDLVFSQAYRPHNFR